MGVIYNSYYSESILKKIRMVFNPPQKRIDDRSIVSKKSRVARDTASYFNASISESDEPSIASSRQLEDIDEVDEVDEHREEDSDDDKSVQNLIDKMVSGKKSN
jgi:hypothetical protein